jgi:hypothetical protein
MPQGVEVGGSGEDMTAGPSSSDFLKASLPPALPDELFEPREIEATKPAGAGHDDADACGGRWWLT